MTKKEKLSEKEEEVKDNAEKHLGVSELHVFDKRGFYVRTYSAVQHGEGFDKIAEGYASKIKGTVRKDK